MAKVTLQGETRTHGQRPEEVGTGYWFPLDGTEPRSGDISRANRGRYQGSEYPAVGELDDRMHLAVSQNDQQVYAFPNTPFEIVETHGNQGYRTRIERGYDASECIAMGLLTVVDQSAS